MPHADLDGAPGSTAAPRPLARLPVEEPARSLPPRHVLMTADAVGGVWRYSLDLGEALQRRGVRTTLAVMGPGPSGAQQIEARHAGVTIVHRPFRLEWMDDPWADVERAGRWLLELERTVHPDVIHLNGYAHAALPFCAPVVVVSHSCVRSWWRAVKGEAAPDRFSTYGEAVRCGLSAARLVIAPTAAMLRALAAEYGLAVSSRVIPNGTGSATIGAEPRWDSKEPMVLAAGRVWDEAKNLDALCVVAPEWPWPVYVAGDHQSPAGAVRPLDGVRPLGQLDRLQLADWQRRASIYVSPARYEPFGLSILEAASAGCALVLGDIPSLRENWDGAAVFVPVDDAAALSRSVQALIDDRNQRRTYGERAWKRAGRFTIERTADEYLRAYEDVAA